MKYETFYSLFLSHGFQYITTERNADIYGRDGNTYQFCFVCGHIIKNNFGMTKFERSIQGTKDFLINYFNEEKKNQTAAA